MAFSLKLFFSIMVSLSTWITIVTPRVMAMPLPLSSTMSPSIAARLQFDDDNNTNNECWKTMFELQHCTGEVILFFLNGETYFGSACCHALLTIAQQCWPEMLLTLGLTPQEGDLLRDNTANKSNKSLTPFASDVHALSPMPW